MARTVHIDKYARDAGHWRSRATIAYEAAQVNVYDGKEYRMLNCKKTNGNIPDNVVFPSQFAHLVIQYQKHPEAKSLAPDESACKAETKGLLRRAHVIAEEIRYVGKETDRKWEEGDEISLLDFSATEYGRKGKVVANEEELQFRELELTGALGRVVFTVRT